LAPDDVVLVPVEEPDEEEVVEGKPLDDELSPLDSFFAAAPLDELSDEAPARLSVR
jgi:hypothetical protein